MNTKQILSAMKIVSWIIFIGLCIKAGAIIISFCITLFVNAEGASDLYLGLDLSTLYETNKRYFINLTSFIITIDLLKAYLFYLVVKIFTKMNLNKPFSNSLASLITKISYVSFSMGLIAIIASAYNKWLMHKGMTSQLNWESSSYLFMAGIIFIIAVHFKRGIELQTENELTI